MNVSTQRVVDRWLGVPLCWLLTLAHRLTSLFGGRQAVMHTPQNILVVLLSEMGSLVLAYPMLRRLHQQHPQARIQALMFARNKEVIDLLGLVPNVEVLTVRDTGFLALFVDALAAIGKMRRTPIDAVIDCELFSRVSAVFSALSGARERVGFHRHTQEGLYRGDFMTRKVLYNPHRHIADQFLALAAGLGGNDVPASKLVDIEPALSFEVPQLLPSEAELASAREKLVRLCPGVDQRPLALMYVSGGALPIRAWPVAHFQALAHAWVADGYAVAVVGLPSDRLQAQALVDATKSPHCFSLAGETANVRELIVMFHHAKVMVANDGGPGHFAALANLPTVMLFGPETPRLYGSLSHRVIAIHRSQTPCSPCLTAFNHRLSPCDGDNVCLKKISPFEVQTQARLVQDIAKAPAP